LTKPYVTSSQATIKWCQLYPSSIITWCLQLQSVSFEGSLFGH